VAKPRPLPEDGPLPRTLRAVLENSITNSPDCTRRRSSCCLKNSNRFDVSLRRCRGPCRGGVDGIGVMRDLPSNLNTPVRWQHSRLRFVTASKALADSRPAVVPVGNLVARAVEDSPTDELQVVAKLRRKSAPPQT